MMKLKPMSPSKLALIENLLGKMSDFLKIIEEMEKDERKKDENVVSMLKASVEILSENIIDFKSLEVNEKLFLLAQQSLKLAQHSLKSGVVFMRLLKKNLGKEITPEISELMKKSGLICGLLV